MEDNEHINPIYMNKFFHNYLGCDLPQEPVTGLSINYTFKIGVTTHKTIKLKAIEHDLPMNEFLGRLIAKYYK